MAAGPAIGNIPNTDEARCLASIGTPEPMKRGISPLTPLLTPRTAFPPQVLLARAKLPRAIALPSSSSKFPSLLGCYRLSIYVFTINTQDAI
jgi:hypothetical protein